MSSLRCIQSKYVTSIVASSIGKVKKNNNGFFFPANRGWLSTTLQPTTTTTSGGAAVVHFTNNNTSTQQHYQLTLKATFVSDSITVRDFFIFLKNTSSLSNGIN
jgi:hypothetical protein